MKTNRPISKWWNKQKKRNKIIIGILIIGIIGSIFVFAMGDMVSTANQNIKKTNSTTSPTGYNVFENQYIKFTYPNNIVVKDVSSNNQCRVYLFTGNPKEANNLDPKFAGDISNVASNYMVSVDDPTTNLTLNGIQAIEFNDSQLYSINIFYPSKNILFEIYYKQDIAYNTIKNSLKIK